MMTREEAIEELERLLRHWDDLENDKRCFWGYDKEAVALALIALRPVSREVVDRIWPGCDYCKHAWMEGLDLKPCANGNIDVELTIGRTSKDDAFGILAYYRNAAAGYIDFPFCPFCGRPMTDEAVEMVMERLEALHGET